MRYCPLFHIVALGEIRGFCFKNHILRKFVTYLKFEIMKLISKMFYSDIDLANFVNSHKIKRENIQIITSTGAAVHIHHYLFYWEEL